MKKILIKHIMDTMFYDEVRATDMVQKLNRAYRDGKRHTSVHGVEFSWFYIDSVILLRINNRPWAQITIGTGGHLISATNAFRLYKDPKPRCIDAFGNTCTEQDLDRRVQKKMYYEDVR